MNKIVYFFLLIIFLNNCSFNSSSKFWSESKKIIEENTKNIQEILVEDKALSRELNPNLKINFTGKANNTESGKFLNNYGRLNYNGNLKRSSRYKFSKIKNFHQFEPSIIFNNGNIIFFDNKGAILKFNEKSKLIWKKNFYTKQEKKLKPILQFSNNQEYLIVADNIKKYYLLDINNGNLIWEKKNLSPFNSQIKIYKQKFFIIDYTNTLRCFSLKNGNELWNVKTENSFIRSQKKLSMVISNDTLYFNNSIGDITAVDIDKGELIWQLPTQSSLIYESAFSLETSDLISDSKTLFFSNNKNQFFSIDLGTGSFNWENKVNANIRPILIGNYLITVSLEGYLIIIEKNSGNILRVNYVFNNFNQKKIMNIKPSGIAIGFNDIYVSTNHGRLLVVDLLSGKIKRTLKIDNEKISRPFISNKNLFVIKDNAIIKLN